MRVLIQRVTEARVAISGAVHASIGYGILVFASFEDADSEDDLDWMASKLVNLRIFNDAEGIMNVSVKEVSGEILVVSQFTLHASTKKGNRPSYIRAAKPDIAIPLYEKFLKVIADLSGLSVKSGVFGADMKIGLLNDGPVTIWMDSREKY